MTHIARNLGGWRIGKSHPRAKLSDSQVRAMRHDHQHGGFGYKRLAHRYHCGISTARDICTYATRYDT